MTWAKVWRREEAEVVLQDFLLGWVGKVHRQRLAGTARKHSVGKTEPLLRVIGSHGGF